MHICTIIYLCCRLRNSKHEYNCTIKMVNNIIEYIELSLLNNTKQNFFLKLYFLENNVSKNNYFVYLQSVKLNNVHISIIWSRFVTMHVLKIYQST